jgi:hypothetical protein
VTRRQDHVIKRSYPCHAYRNTGLRESQTPPRYKPGTAQKVLIGETGRRRMNNVQQGAQNTNVLRAGAAGQEMLRGPSRSPWASPHCTTCQAMAKKAVAARAKAKAAAARPVGERVPW